MDWVGNCLLITTEKTTVITNFNPDYRKIFISLASNVAR